MKIICVGRNYAAHIDELKNETPEAPVIFMKGDNAILSDNKPFYYPNFSKDIHYECELVFRICKNGKAIQEQFAHKYYDAVTLGIDFTARDLQDYQKQKGLPWEVAKAFDHSAVIGEFMTLSEERKQEPYLFSLKKNDMVVQEGDSRLMLHSLHKIISYAAQFFSLKMGDLLFTGTPKGVGSIAIGDSYSASLNNTPLLHVDIK